MNKYHKSLTEREYEAAPDERYREGRILNLKIFEQRHGPVCEKVWKA